MNTQGNVTRGKKLPKEPLTRDEFLKLLSTFSKRCPTGKRNRAMVVIAYRAGLRLGEVLSLRPSDIDLERGSVNVRHGKGDKQRKVGLDPMACEIVASWASERASLGIGKNAPLFCTLEGAEIKQPYVRALLKRKAAQAGIEKRVHFHGLRASYAQDLVQEGIDIVRVQKSLGHKSLNTTQVYVESINPKAIIDLAQNREW